MIIATRKVILRAIFPYLLMNNIYDAWTCLFTYIFRIYIEIFPYLNKIINYFSKFYIAIVILSIRLAASINVIKKSYSLNQNKLSKIEL